MSSLDNTSLPDNQYTDEIINKIQSQLQLTDYEVSLLKLVNTELKKPLPTTQAGLGSRVAILDSLRVKLLNFIYAVSSKCSQLEYNYKTLYDPKFVTLTRAGRPNQQSVDSEIHIDLAMQEQRLTLWNFDNFKGLLYGYLKSIDKSKESCISASKGDL